ncbi:MAG: hypothetical protein VR68_12555 [Peptococcaceae bacterium BRH_c4a]|nr:MAG: hypothetical protein VR68_12555 [Peptococcaceae bacterium BRH_c4a]
MQGQLIGWAIWFFVIVLSAFTVPYYLLSNVAKVYGAFLYWGIFAIVAIISVGIITSKWRD